MEDFGLETEPTSDNCRNQMKFQVSPAPRNLAPFEKETLLTPALIVATAFDRAVTVRERDPDS